MTINFNTKTIELTKTEMTDASKYGSQMYRDLMDARRDNPDFRVVEIKSKTKKVKSPLDSLNLATIKAYVKMNGSPEQKQKFLTISNATITEEGAILPAKSFPEIKKWFLVEFPKYKAALEAHEAEMNRIFDAVDAKIAEAQKKSAEEARAKAEAEAKSFLDVA